LSPRPAKTARRVLKIYTPNDAVSRKEVLFGGQNASKNLQGVHFPKTPKLGPEYGISSLNITMNNCSTVHAIFAEISSIGAAWQKKFKKLQRNHRNFVEVSLF
jgi:hypothetical protein